MKATKLIAVNVRDCLHDLGVGKEFLDRTNTYNIVHQLLINFNRTYNIIRCTL